MTKAWTRGRVWTLMAIGIAMISLAAWAYWRTGLSWTTVAVGIVAAGCVATMVYLWRVSDRTARTLDDLGRARDPVTPKVRHP